MQSSPVLGLPLAHSPFTESLFARKIFLPPPIDTRDESAFSRTPIVSVSASATEKEESPDDIDLEVLSICEKAEPKSTPGRKTRPSHPVFEAPKGTSKPWSYHSGRDFDHFPLPESSPLSPPLSSPFNGAEVFLNGFQSDSSRGSTPQGSPYSSASSPGDRRIDTRPKTYNRQRRREAVVYLPPMPDSPVLSPSLALAQPEPKFFDFKSRYKISLDRERILSLCDRASLKIKKLPMLAQVFEAIINKHPAETSAFYGSKFLTPQDIHKLFLTCRYFWKRRAHLLLERGDIAGKALEAVNGAFENIPRSIRGMTAFNAIHIRVLHFKNVVITTTQIQELSLRCKNLSELALMNCGLQSESLSYIKDLTHLTALDLSQNPDIPNGLFYLVDLTDLQHLSLVGCYTIKDRHLQFLDGLTQLKVLNLSENKLLTSLGLSRIRNLKLLTHLDLGHLPYVDDSLSLIISRLVHLLWLRLCDCPNIKDPSLKAFATIPKLKTLGLEITSITHRGLIHLAQSKRLKDLYIANCPGIKASCLERFVEAISGRFAVHTGS